MKGKLLVGFVKTLLACALIAMSSPAWAAISLGQAGNYAVFQLGGGGNWNTSDAFVQGNVAVGPSTPNASVGNLAVNGNVYDADNFTGFNNVKNWTDAPLGSNPTVLPTYSGTVTHNVNLNQAVADALSASTAATALGVTPDFNLGALSSSQTVNLNSVTPHTPGVYVIDTTSLQLGGGEALVLNGAGIPAGSQVIINVTGQFALTGGGAITLSGGLTTSQVLVNNTSTQAASITGSSLLFGSFLGPNLNAQFNNNAAAVYGQVIAESIQFSSHFRVYGTPFVPEPATFVSGALLLLPFGAGVLRIVRKKR